VRYVLLLLKQSIIAQYFHKPFWVLEELETSAADVMWELCTAPQTVYLHNKCTKPLSSRIGQNLQQVLCEVYVLLLLKQSIAQHFHKPLSSPRIGHFSSAADFMWGMCCCYSINLLHNTSTNPWILQELETNAPDVMWPVCVATEINSIAQHFHNSLRFSNWTLLQQISCEVCAVNQTMYCILFASSILELSVKSGDSNGQLWAGTQTSFSTNSGGKLSFTLCFPFSWAPALLLHVQLL
jgi:hypothetical protein